MRKFSLNSVRVWRHRWLCFCCGRTMRTGPPEVYQVISGCLTLDPPRGKARLLFEQLAGKNWILQSGEAAIVRAETILLWLRLCANGGFEALGPSPKNSATRLSSSGFRCPTDPSSASSPSWRTRSWQDYIHSP